MLPTGCAIRFVGIVDRLLSGHIRAHQGGWARCRTYLVGWQWHNPRIPVWALGEGLGNRASKYEFECLHCYRVSCGAGGYVRAACRACSFCRLGPYVPACCGVGGETVAWLSCILCTMWSHPLEQICEWLYRNPGYTSIVVVLLWIWTPASSNNNRRSILDLGQTDITLCNPVLQ